MQLFPRLGLLGRPGRGTHAGFDVYDRRDLFPVLDRHDCPRPGPPAEPRSLLGALGLLMRPAVRRRFPTALSDGPRGQFARWVAAPAAWWALGDRVRRVFECRDDLRTAFPLALTPAQRGPYLSWLLDHGRTQYGLRDEEILWWLFESAEDPSHGLWPTYKLTPGWQRGGVKRIRRSARDAGAAGGWVRRARIPRQATPGLGVNVLAPFRFPSGVQVEADAVVGSLRDAGLSVSRRDVPVDYPHADHRERGMVGLETHPVTLIKSGGTEPLAGLYRRAGLHPRDGVRRVAMWSWELEAFPAVPTDLVDEVWGPTAFVADAIRKTVTEKPVRAMLPALNLPKFDVRPRSHFGLDDRFLFLFMFDMGSVMERKNPLGLITAFKKAFPEGGPRLAIKVSRGDSRPDDLRDLRRAAAAGGVTVIDRVMPRAESLALLDCCDAYVSLHRSEGVGLSMAEAMLLGKPVVATGYSGNLDFMTAGTSLLVDFDLVPLERDIPPYPAGAKWAAPRVEHAAGLMRRVFAGGDDMAEMADAGRRHAEAVFSPDACGRRMRDRVEELSC